MGLCMIAFFSCDYIHDHKKQQQLIELMKYDDLVAKQVDDFINRDIAIHDIEVLEKKMNELFEANCNLEDYMAKWCHEMKIPLSALLLMNEKQEDFSKKQLMQEQLERIKQLVNQSMIGCRTQSLIYDLQIKQVNLQDCIKASIQNNQFFLIKNHFEMNVECCDILVYSDSQWLVYILDQLMSNSLKYCSDHPQLHIWSERKENQTYLYIEDNGEGIQKSDIPHVLEKGYTGSNYHNGKYKSTGMGLYFVDMIIKKLGHDLKIESEYGAYTRITIVFSDLRDFYLT